MSLELKIAALASLSVTSTRPHSCAWGQIQKTFRRAAQQRPGRGAAA